MIFQIVFDIVMSSLCCYGSRIRLPPVEKKDTKSLKTTEIADETRCVPCNFIRWWTVLSGSLELKPMYGLVYSSNINITGAVY